jgi:hypothetical protein
VIERSREAEAFLSTVDAADPAAVSACEGWTTHEIAAHVAGIAVEVVRHLVPYLSGDPVPATRSFEEREAPLQAMAHPRLVARLDREEQRMRSVVSDVLDREPQAVIPWTGRPMAVAKFVPHLRKATMRPSPRSRSTAPPGTCSSGAAGRTSAGGCAATSASRTWPACRLSCPATDIAPGPVIVTGPLARPGDPLPAGPAGLC